MQLQSVGIPLLRFSFIIAVVPKRAYTGMKGGKDYVESLCNWW